MREVTCHIRARAMLLTRPARPCTRVRLSAATPPPPPHLLTPPVARSGCPPAPADTARAWRVPSVRPR
eukprot:4217203-Prymnesium_polylepis.1